MTTTSLLLCLVSAFGAFQGDADALESPEVLLERAELAARTGDLAKAESWLRRAAAAGDPAVKGRVAEKLSALDRILGRAAAKGQGEAGTGKPSAEAPLSPLLRRFSADVARYLERRAAGEAKAAGGDMREIASLTGAAGLPHLKELLDAAPPSDDVTVIFDIVDWIVASDRTSDASFEFLVAFAKAEDPLVRKLALRSLAKASPVDSARPRDVAIEFCRAADPTLRAAGVELLARHPEGAAAILPSLTRDPAPGVRAAVATLFLASPALTAADRARLAEDTDTNVSLAVLGALGEVEASEIGKILLLLARSKDPTVLRGVVKMFALRGLAGAPAAEAAEVLTRLATHPQLDVRRNVDSRNRAVRELGVAGAVLLLRRVTDEDPQIWGDALTALGIAGTGPEARTLLGPATEALAVAVAHAPLPSNPTHVQRSPAFFYAEAYAKFVAAVARPEDLTIVLPSLRHFPSPGELQSNETSSILGIAGKPQRKELLDFAESCESKDLRVAILRRVVQLSRGASAAERKEFAPVFRRLLSQDRAVLRFISELGLIELEPEILAAVDASGPEWLFEQYLSPLFAADPKVGMRIAIRIVNRFDAEPSTVKPHSPRSWIVEKTRAENAEIVAAFLADDAFWNRLLTKLGSKAAHDFAGGISVKLAQSGDPRACSRLEGIARSSSVEAVRIECVRGLAAAKGDEGIEFLGSVAVNDPSVGVRQAALDGLRERRAFDDRTVERVAALLDDPDLAVHVAHYFASAKDAKVVPYLRRLLKSPSADARSIACRGLDVTLSEDLVPDLLELLADPEEGNRKRARELLERIRFYHNEKRLWDEWSRTKGDPRGGGIPKLLTALEDPDPAVRIAAVESLGTLKAKEALPALVDRMRATAPGAERDAFARAIAKINE